MSIAEITRKTDFLRDLARAGLSLPQALVLAHLVEAVDVSGLLNEGELTIQLSRYDIASRTGLSPSQVQRALVTLVDAGLIVRKQLQKKDGEVAMTMLLPAALRLMSSSGTDVPLTDSIPLHVASLLIGQPRELVAAVCASWRDLTPFPAHIESIYRGTAEGLATLRTIMVERLAKQTEAVAAAVQASERQAAAEDRGEYTLDLPSGETVTLSRTRFVNASSDYLGKCVDMRFVRDALAQVARRAPALVTRASLPRLIADIAFSRTAGFVFSRDAADAVRILASCITRPGWSKPKRMDTAWYDTAACAIC